MLVGRSSCGGECWLNHRWVEADLRIATGFIEPHFYAGFSGGSKSIVPGIAGLKTVQHFHRSQLIANPGTTWGDPRANPVQAKLSYLLNGGAETPIALAAVALWTSAAGLKLATPWFGKLP